jgi:hypothetical protein
MIRDLAWVGIGLFCSFHEHWEEYNLGHKSTYDTSS